MLIKTTNFLLRFALGAVLIMAGALKVFDPAGFATNIHHYRMVPNEFINIIAIVMPWVELGAGLCLVMGMWVRASAALAGFLSCVFAVAVTQALARGLNIECGCFGTLGGSQIGLKHLTVDVAMLAASAWLVHKNKD